MDRDLRKYAKNTTIRSVIGFLILLFVVGDGLIYFIYGPSAALTGLLCIFGGIFPVFLIYATFLFLDFVVKKANE